MTETAPIVFASPDALRPQVGREVAVSPWLRIDQDRVNAFAEVTEDRQWIHLDAERAARESPFGAPVAHGFLTLSLLPRLIAASYRLDGVRMGVNYGLNKVRFMSPVRVGARLRGRFTLLSLTDIDGGVQCVWQATLELDGVDKPACVAELVTRAYR